MDNDEKFQFSEISLPDPSPNVTGANFNQNGQFAVMLRAAQQKRNEAD